MAKRCMSRFLCWYANCLHSRSYLPGASTMHENEIDFVLRYTIQALLSFHR